MHEFGDMVEPHIFFLLLTSYHDFQLFATASTLFNDDLIFVYSFVPSNSVANKTGSFHVYMKHFKVNECSILLFAGSCLCFPCRSVGVGWDWDKSRLQS